LRYGAAYEVFGAQPDLIMLGKIIGGGMPIGALAGRAELMDLLAPLGPVYQAGTLSGNPIAVRAGLETLKLLAEPGVYDRLEAAGARLANGLGRALEASGAGGCVQRAGSLMTLFHGVAEVRDAEGARRSDTAAFTRFFHAMLERGIYLPPSQFEAMFVSLAHSDADLDATITAASEALSTDADKRDA
jgi:glutamate-1-semialdehyde 2,1-aminomutase